MMAVITAFLMTFLAWLFWLEGRWTESFSDRLLKALIFSQAQIFLTVLILAGLGILSIFTIFPCHIAVLIGIYITRKRDFSEMFSSGLNRFIEFFQRLPSTIKMSPASSVFIGIVMVELLWLGIYSASMPIHGWDALAYHLAIPAGIAKTGSLIPLPVSYENVINYVGTPHLIYAWAALFPIKSGFLSIFHWGYLLMAILSVYSCLRTLKVSATVAALVSGAAGLAPIFILESVRLYADIAVAALFMSCLVQFYHWMRTRNSMSFVTAVLSLGMMHAAKLQCILFTLIILFWVISFMKVPRRDFFKPATLSLLLISLLISSFWFFYRYQRFHNPLYPVEVRLFDHTFFPGYVDPVDGALDFRVKPPLIKEMYRHPEWKPFMKPAKILVSWLELSHTQHDYIHTVSGGFGPLMVVLLLPAALGTLIWRMPGRAFLLLLILLGLTQLGHAARYTPMISLILAIPAGIFMSRNGIERWILPVAGLFVYILISVLNPFLASGFGEIIINGPIEDIFKGKIGAGSIFFSGFILLALISFMFKKNDWWMFLFIPVLIITIGLTYHFPSKKQVKIIFASREDQLAFCFQRRPLHIYEYQWEQMMLGRRAADRTEKDDILYYSGDPFPCVMGMMWNEEMSNIPMHTTEEPLPGEFIGCKSDYCITINHDY